MVFIASPTMMPISEDETTFLCGYQRQRRYGSLSTPAATKPRYTSIVHHHVEPTDTLQGIALRYNSSMTEIKRLNKLWSNESMFLKSSLRVPINDDQPSTPTTSSTPTDAASNGGDRDYASSSSTPASPPFVNGVSVNRSPTPTKDVKGVVTVNTARATTPSARPEGSYNPVAAASSSSAHAKTPETEESASDLFSRIDNSIRSTARNVQRLERNSTLDDVSEDGSSRGGLASSISGQSVRSIPLVSSPTDPPCVETKRLKKSLSRLQKSHDQFYEL